MLTRAGIAVALSVAALLTFSNLALVSDDSSSTSNSPCTQASDRLASETCGDGRPQLAWEAVKSGLADSIGVNPDEREQLRASMMEGPVEVDLDWIEQRHPGARRSPALHEAHSRAIELSLDLSVACSDYFDELDQSLKLAFNEGRVLRSTEPGALSVPTEPLIFMQTANMGGWSTVLALRREDYPQLAYKQRLIVDRVHARDQEIARILRGG